MEGRPLGLMDMPIEILIEVVSHSTPLDLLYLARTSKTLRSILMSTSSRDMWMRSRRNVPASSKGREFPACPPYLSEPEYASLLFAKICQACGRDGAICVYLTSYVRLCWYCSAHGRLLNGVHWFSELCKIPSSIKKAERDAMFNLIPKKPHTEFFTPLIAQDKFRQFMIRRGKMGEAPFLKYLKEQARVARSDPAVSLMIEASKWYAESLEDQLQRDREITAKREECIRARLLQDGWDSTNFPQSSDTELLGAFDAMLQEPKPLTEESWEDLRPKLQEIRDQVRVKREKEEHAKHLREEIKTFFALFLAAEATPDTLPGYPTESDVLRMPSIAFLLEDTALDSPITVERWTLNLERLREDIREYERGTRRALAYKARATLQGLATLHYQADSQFARLRQMARGVEPGRLDIEDDAVNTDFLTKDPSRLAFCRGGDWQPYSAALGANRSWRVEQDSLLLVHHATEAALFLRCRIDRPESFELVDGIWT